MKHLTHIEPLESRIAPATIMSPYVVTYQDLDYVNGVQVHGNTVQVTISKPLFTSPHAAAKILNFTDSNGNSINESFTGNTTAEYLGTIDLLGRADASGMNISVKVIPQIGVGSGTVNVGEILAADFPGNGTVTENIALGSIYVQGNLGLINAGSDIVSTPAIQSLTVGSMNIGGNGVESQILGGIPKMTVQGDFNTFMDVFGYRFGSIGTLTIGGSLAADSSGDADTGLIRYQGHIGTATIGNITGGAGNDSGELLGESSLPSYIGSLHVLGSITGGNGIDSGRVFAEAAIGKVIVGGSVLGGNAGVAAASSTASPTPGESGIISATSIGSISIGGSLIGGTAGTGTNTSGIVNQTADTSGAILVGTVRSIMIGHDVTGGTGPTSGVISAFSAGSISIGGSLIGGTGSTAAISGAIGLDSVKSITIGGNITGESASDSGIIAGYGLITGQTDYSTTTFGSIVVHGNVTGGSGSASGAIMSNGLLGGTITSLTIDGNLAGGTGNSTTALVGSGYILAGQYGLPGHIGTLDIKGNITSGSNGTVEVANAGAIRSSGDILALTIGGTVTGTSAVPVVISAEQGESKSAHPATDLAFQSVTIGGAAQYLDILAGYGPRVSNSSGTDSAGAPLGTPADGSAQIGTVHFESTLAATNIVAGAEQGSGGFFGTADNTAIAGQIVPGLASSIASIIVAGQASGDSTLTDSFGFVAQQLHTVNVNGVAVATASLTPGTPVPVNGTNLHLLEVS